MSKDVQIGQDIYSIPDNLENPGYGEELSDYLVAVGDTLNDLQGVNDITLTTSNISDSQSSFVNVEGLLFDTGAVKTFSAPYIVIRSVDGTTNVEAGTMHGAFDGTTWSLLVNDVQQDAGVAFFITAGGQVQYKTDTLVGTNYSGLIKFKAKTLDN